MQYHVLILNGVIDISPFVAVSKKGEKIRKHLINRVVGIFKWIVKNLCVDLHVSIV
jgi:hypothetical protein